MVDMTARELTLALIVHLDMPVTVMLTDNTTVDVRTVVADPATGAWTILLNTNPTDAAGDHATDR